jgi:DNA-binding NarL/FixJ family response regulator
MARNICGQEVSRVKIVDDDTSAREGMIITVKDADLEPLPDAGPLPQLREFVLRAKRGADAVLCDHSLMRADYASFNGAEAVASLYNQKCPAVLCTRWSPADIDAMRCFIRFIPALIVSDDISPDTIVDGIGRCIAEFRNEPASSRKPWRTLIRVETVERDRRPALFYVAISGWDSKQIVRLPLDLIPLEHRLAIEPDFRFYASVNKGAETAEALFFSDMEFPPKG